MTTQFTARPRSRPFAVAVLTSGGDASGMNAAVRAVVRSAVHHHLDVYAVNEGYEGLIQGGDAIRRMTGSSVGGMLHKGGTLLGTARCPAFHTRDGRRAAARNMLAHGIGALIVIGGDGSLTGADRLRADWPGLLDELVAAGDISRAVADAHPRLRLVGIAASIDNDMFGTDMTIGADTALHRIVDALDALDSTASSHQRSFVVEVMGRDCGYLAVMASLASAANWVLIPEQPPDDHGWADHMASVLKEGRARGRRRNLVVVAEGAKDRDGEPITVDDVKRVLEQQTGEDARVTILGHVQRGGPPSAADRYLATLLGHSAVQRLLDSRPDDPPVLVGITGSQVISSPLGDSVAQTRAVNDLLDAHHLDDIMTLRGNHFRDAVGILATLQQAGPRSPDPGRRRPRLAILHGGDPAPGMNTAVRAAVRLGLDRGHTMLAVRGGFRGLRDGHITEVSWMDVTGLVATGGAEIGTDRFVPDAAGIAQIAQQVAAHGIDGLLVAGGWAGYAAAHAVHTAHERHAELDIPIVCLPISVNNDLPGTELTIGSDTALNSIVNDVDKIRQSAAASRRCFVVEVMGNDSGYLAMVSGMITGADRVYLPEEGITLDDLTADIHALTDGFRSGRPTGLIIRSENADPIYSTSFIRALLDKESNGLWDTRQAILGHVHEGGNPSPFDRIQVTRLTARSLDFLAEQLTSDPPGSAMIGFESGRIRFTALHRYPTLVESQTQRPIDQPWTSHTPLLQVMNQPTPARP